MADKPRPRKSGKSHSLSVLSEVSAEKARITLVAILASRDYPRGDMGSERSVRKFLNIRNKMILFGVDFEAIRRDSPSALSNKIVRIFPPLAKDTFACTSLLALPTNRP